MRRIVILLILQIIATDFCFGQLPHTFTQYTSEDGLSQNTIMSILQDDKGVMWFATWDGLYKFDGYTFNNYKAHPGDSIGLSNNRLDNIKEDRYGYIWVQSYNHQVYRFNPRLERFQAIPYDNYLSLDMYVLPCGDVWIITVLLQIPSDFILRAYQVYLSGQPGEPMDSYRERIIPPDS